MSESLYPTLDCQVTLRCNFKCHNCIKFSSMKPQTGLDYSETDVTLDQIDRLIADIRDVGSKRSNPLVFDTIFLTGGEPLLHDKISQIASRIYSLIDAGYVKELKINSNLLIKPPPGLERYIVNFSTTEEKADVHDTMLIHPDEWAKKRVTFKECRHYRKATIVWNWQGYSLCCAGDGYIRLFGLDHLIIDKLPDSYEGFPLDRMDDVCQHCAFGHPARPKEKLYDKHPVSKVYQEQIFQIKNGRKSLKVF